MDIKGFWTFNIHPTKIMTSTLILNYWRKEDNSNTCTYYPLTFLLPCDTIVVPNLSKKVHIVEITGVNS